MQDDGEAPDEVYAYGSEMWTHKWNLMMNKLLDLGLGVYLTSGTNWATSNVPASDIDPASEDALQVLAMSNPEVPMLVKGGETFSGPVELPAAPKDNTRYLFAYNYCPNDYHEHSSKEEVVTEDHGTNFTGEISIEGEYTPYVIDPYSGEVTELAEYRWEDGRTVFEINLDYRNVGLFALEKAAEMKAGTIRATDAASAYMTDGGAVIRVMENGSYTTVLNDGAEIVTEVNDLPAAGDITGWTLDVTSWTAGDAVLTSVEKIGDLVTENKLTTTKYVEIPGIQLDTLTTWDNIPEVGKEVSGTGVYTATFEWDASKASGAYIDFGETLDQSMTLEINGVKVGGSESQNPTKAVKGLTATVYDAEGAEKAYEATGRVEYTGGINWDKPQVDIGAYLVDGTNTIKIVYNSSITNAALAAGIIQPQGIGDGHAWYGAVAIYWPHVIDYRSNGPRQAKLVPYTDVAIAE